MAHNVEYFSYPEKVDRSKVQKDLDHYAAMEDWQEGCTGLYSPIRWLEKVGILSDYDAALAAIRENDRGWYDQLAVRYYVPNTDYTDKKVEELTKKERAAYNAWCEKRNIVWARTLKSEYVSCRCCGSRMKREFLRTNGCPVCGEDLRPETMIKTAEAAELKWKKARDAVAAYRVAHGKRDVVWLVKIEYHT